MSASAFAHLSHLSRSTGLAVLALAIAGCSGHSISIDDAYRNAVQDAAIVEESEIATDLIAIRRDNPDLVWNDTGDKILVATWKSQDAFDRFLKPHDRTPGNPDYAVWVTTVPQVRELCADWSAQPEIGSKGLDLRLKQYLGLAPAWHYDLFVELWVDPERLFRPCVDPQTDDGTCQLHFGEATPVVTNIVSYRDFYRNLYYRSFRGSDGVPWTGLGYTYDWGNRDGHVGASEFILTPDTPYEIRSATPTAEYCAG